MGMLQEFREFAVKGNAMDLAVGVIIGGAFGKIVESVVGDLITAAMGAYIVWEARNLGMSRWHLVRMGGNVAFDSAIGAIPLVGDAFDFFYRSNSRNLKIIRRYLDKHHPETRLIEQ